MTVSHASLTGAELHEPKGVAAAAVDTIYVANGAGSGTWKIPDYKSMPPGSVLQVQYSQTNNTAGTISRIPDDGTIPQNTEGLEILTVTITPKLSTSVLMIEALFQGGSDFNNDLALALFKDSDVNAIAVTSMQTQAGYNTVVPLLFFVSAGSTSARTYKLRYGLDAGSGTAYMNLDAGGSLFGGVTYCVLKVTEIKQ